MLAPHQKTFIWVEIGGLRLLLYLPMDVERLLKWAWSWKYMKTKGISMLMGLREGDWGPKSITPPVGLQSDCETWHRTHAQKDDSHLVARVNSIGFDRKESWQSEARGLGSEGRALLHHIQWRIALCSFAWRWWVQCFDGDKYAQETLLTWAAYSLAWP